MSSKRITIEKPFLAIVMPAYDERGTIEEIIKRVKATPFQKEIIIVDDCSTDGTSDILAKIQDPEIRVVRHAINQGKGAALRTGFASISAQANIVIIQDADLEYDPNDYCTLIEPITRGDAEVVYGSRFLGSHQATMFWHMIANKMLTLLTNILYNTILTDMETGYKAFRVDVVQKLLPKLKANRFDFEPEITAKVLKNKCRMFEVPIRYAFRPYEEGKKIGMKDAFAAVYALVRYRIAD
jgi:glycosyltransferase involved in cell wall biosynthesis